MTTPPCRSETNAIFHDPALLDDEQARIFQGGWVLVGTADQLPAPDTHFVYEAQGRSVLVTRDAEGGLRAFVNACTHRGTRLCASAGSGKLQCPYHGWVYANDGRLLGATRRAGLPPFQDADLALRPLAIDQVGGFLFVHGSAAPAVGLRDTLGEMATNLERLTASLGTFLFEVRLPIEGNWKLAVCGGIEDYHAPFVHRQATTNVRIGENVTTLAPNGHSWFALAAPVPRALRALLRVLTGAFPHPELESHCVFPNVTIVTLWSLMHVTNWIPVAPGRTLRVTRWYSKMAPPGPRTLRRLLLPLLVRVVRRRALRVMTEDQWIVGEAQLGTRAGVAMPRGPAHVQESRVEHLLDEVALRIDAPDGQARRDASRSA